MLPELVQYVQLTSLLWLRCVPLFLLTPYLAVGVVSVVWSGLLSWAFAGSLAPLVLAGCGADSACGAALSGGVTWELAVSELTSGVVIALGLGLPCAAFRTLGAIAQGLGGSQDAAASSTSQLGRLAGLIALVAIASAGGLTGVSQLLLTVAPPLTAAHAPALELLRPLSDQLLRAFELGVSLSGPLLLAAVIVAIGAGLVGRVSGLRLSSVGPALLPWLGIAIVSLCVANWLDSLPELVRAFAQSTTRLLNSIP
jgi:flagellar biosynthesis protein FliR